MYFFTYYTANTNVINLWFGRTYTINSQLTLAKYSAAKIYLYLLWITLELLLPVVYLMKIWTYYVNKIYHDNLYYTVELGGSTRRDEGVVYVIIKRLLRVSNAVPTVNMVSK